jgi:hypothetical protein
MRDAPRAAPSVRRRGFASNATYTVPSATPVSVAIAGRDRRHRRRGVAVAPEQPLG